MIYNYRFNRDLRADIEQRLRNEGVLSQGWGGGSNAHLDLRDNDFVQKCKSHYELVRTNIPTNLTRIRQFTKGDWLVVPQMPEDGKVSIHVVAQDYPACYDYIVDDDTDQNHRITISESFGMSGEVSVQTLMLSRWYAKLRWMRLPVLPIPQFSALFREVVTELTNDSAVRLDKSELADYLGKLKNVLLDKIASELSTINPSGSAVSFESVCEQLIRSAGYEIAGNNIYDGQGGDVDRRCIRRRSEVSPFEIGETVMLVQIKKHQGVTSEAGIEQLLKMLEKENDATEGCVMTLAKNFSPEAEETAKRNDIALLRGDEICELLLWELAGA